MTRQAPTTMTSRFVALAANRDWRVRLLGDRRLLIGGILVALLIAAMVLIPFFLYRRGRTLRERLTERVDTLDISIERAGRQMAQRERQLRLFLLTRDPVHLSEFQLSSMRLDHLFGAMMRDVPRDRHDWVRYVTTLHATAREWESASQALVHAGPASGSDRVIRAETLGRPGPIYERYREQSAHFTESVYAERVKLRQQLARIDLARLTVPVPLALFGIFVVAYVLSLSLRVSALLEIAGAEHQRLASVLEQMADPVLVTDASGNVSLANRAAISLLRIGLGDAATRLLEGGRLALPDGRQPAPEALPLLRALTHGETVQGTEMVAAARGEQRPVSASASPIVGPTGERIGAVMVLRDLTDRVRYERERLKAEKFGALGTMAQRVAHDFGNFLEAASAATVMLERDSSRDDAQRLRWAGIIRTTVDQGRAALDALRALSLLSTRRLRVATCDVNVLTSRAIEVARMARPEAARAVTFQHRGGEVPPIQASQPDMLRSLVNVLTNAIDAMPKGGKITIDVGHEGGQVVVAITDTGVGIPPEQLEHIFDLYYTTKGDRGSGLGLTTAREVIALHGGTLTASSRVGVGSTFTVRLPVAPVAEDGEASAARRLPADAPEADASAPSSTEAPHAPPAP